MTFVKIEPGTLFQAETEAKPKSRNIYKAVPCTDYWGQGDGVGFITGITLERLTPEPDWDPIYDEIVEAGTDAQIILPKEGLILGEVYEAVGVSQRDWETGIVDGYEIYLERIEDCEEEYGLQH